MWVQWKTRKEEHSGGVENSPCKGEQRKAYSRSNFGMPLLKLPLERNYSEKWHIKRLSHSKFSMDINNCLSNHVKMGTRG